MIVFCDLDLVDSESSPFIENFIEAFDTLEACFLFDFACLPREALVTFDRTVLLVNVVLIDPFFEAKEITSSAFGKIGLTAHLTWLMSNCKYCDRLSQEHVEAFFLADLAAQGGSFSLRFLG